MRVYQDQTDRGSSSRRQSAATVGVEVVSMAMTALFGGRKKREEREEKRRAVPMATLAAEEERERDAEMDGDGEREGSAPIRRNSRFYRSMRKKRSRGEQEPSHTPSPQSSRDSASSQNKNTPSTPRSPRHQRPASALPSNGLSRSPRAAEGGASSPLATAGDGRGSRGMEELARRTEECSIHTHTHTHTRYHTHALSPTHSNGRADPEDVRLRLMSGEDGRMDSHSNILNIVKNVECLYQEYRVTSKQQEVEERRRVERESAQAHAHAHTHTHTHTATHTHTHTPTVHLQLRSSSLSLWQNLPAVQHLLTNMTPRDIILQEAMFELVTSEASYYKSLELLETHFLRNSGLLNTLSQSDAHFLFSNIQDVMKASEKFLMDLEHRLEESLLISDVCDIVHQHAQTHFNVFITYVINQGYQEKHYRRIMLENELFREQMQQLENQPCVKGLSFTSFLILPFQRICRLKLLVQNILKKVEENTEREMNAIQAHRELERIVRECNEGVRKMSRTEELISIEKTLEFKTKSVPVISHSRWLLKKGNLLQMSGPKSTRTLKSKKLYTPVYLFLFNNLLLVTKPTSGDRFLVLDSCSRSMLRTEDLTDQGQTLAHAFSLKLLENQEDRGVSYLLKASSMSDKLRWMCTLTPNRRTRFMSTSAHQPDAPQVQCVQSYSAQEPDELSIEMADVLHVLENSDDGWVLGERLHDGERGWFPWRVVEEIQSAELRAQNLRECQRIQQAQGSRGRHTHSRSQSHAHTHSHGLSLSHSSTGPL
ncbi:ephexin-1 isoform X3 [Alosa alosa]|uniref:ephexin-1 isoform X2 n=1 Tax=Alosa alosa TaxID=278164 RepID=UPI0020155216|nr:ephexin-1 isoform X2 [Alosa alosa]XP_048120927.1 ephexin-1 isoform X3 [Alosa alosa]